MSHHARLNPFLKPFEGKEVKKSISWIFLFFFSEAESQVTQAGLELTLQAGVTWHF